MADISTLNGYNLKDAQARQDIVTINGKIGSANGIAELDANGRVPSSQLPSYVDDVLEYASQSAFPATGETGKIYIALDTNKTYRWSGTAYVEISESLALGETSSTAYAGNKGKANADAITAMKDGSSIDSFGDVETALAGKVDKVAGKGLSTNDYDATAKGIVDNIQDNVKANTQLISESIWGESGKNELPNNLANKTELGVTFAHNDNDTISLSGLATANVDAVIYDTRDSGELWRGETLIASKGINNNAVRILVNAYNDNTYVKTLADVNSGTESNPFTIDYNEYNRVRVTCYVNNGTNTDGITLFPMFRDANILDPTFEPYHPSVKDILEDKVNWIDNTLTGVHQFLRYDLPLLKANNTVGTWNNNVYTVGGITFTFNADKSITVETDENGATATINFMLNKQSDYNYSLLSGRRYSYQGAPSEADANIYLECYISSPQNWYRDYGDGVEIAFPTAAPSTYNLNLTVRSGKVITTPITFKPLLKLVDDADNSFTDYAMTNKELTEKVTPIKNNSAITFAEGVTPAAGDQIAIYKIGDLKILSMYVTGATISANTWFILGTLSDEFKPSAVYDGFANVNGKTDVCDVMVQSDKILRFRNNSGAVASTDIIKLMAIYV